MLSDGDDVGASHFGDGYTAIGLVGGVEVDMVGANAGCDCDLEILGLCETLSCEVAGMEAGAISTMLCVRMGECLRSGDNDFGVDEFLVEGAVLTLLVGGGHERMSLIFEPFSDSQLVLGCA
jgi:hypothetical protein